MGLSEYEREIHKLGQSYFCVSKVSPTKIIELLDLGDVETMTSDRAHKQYYPLDLIGTSHNEKVRHLISAEIDGWVVVYSECGIYEYCKEIVEKLLTITTQINYYYGDSCVDCYEWIITEEGKIIREFCYQMGEISVNKGNCITGLESRFIEASQDSDSEFIFGEDVLSSVISETCSLKKKHHNGFDQFFIGYHNNI